MEFLLTLLVLLLLAKLVGELLHHYGISSLVGEVVVGVALGPAVLGWIKPDAYIEAIAWLGLVVLMLVAGMNSRFDLLHKVKFKATAIAVCGMGVAFALGFALIYGWGYGLLPSLFVAAALSGTATEVVARVTEGTRLSQLAVSAAVIDDIPAIYVIGILSTAALWGVVDLGVLAWATVGVAAFFLAVGYFSRALMVKADVMRGLWRFERRGVPLTFALCFALALAVIARRVGLHEITGAYMAGLFIGRMRERPDALLLSKIRLNAILDDVTTSLQAILTPMFFVYVGLALPTGLGGASPLLLTALVIVAFAGKLMGCGLGAAAVGYTRRDSVTVGVSMCPRGSLEFAVLHFGLVSGVIAGDLFAAMVMTTLATVILTPVLFKFVLRALG